MVVFASPFFVMHIGKALEGFSYTSRRILKNLYNTNSVAIHRRKSMDIRFQAGR